MRKLVQLKDINGNNLDPKNFNYENRIKNLEGTVLWTNANPISDFVAQNISVDLTNYDKYEIIYYSSKGDMLALSTGILPKIGNGTKLAMFYNAMDNHFYTTREVDFISSGLGFYDAIFESFTGGGQGTSNNRLIPLYIIGYKS